MCGIFGYTGRRSAVQFVIDGLLHLKYRGYDSAGIAMANGATIERFRIQGKPELLANQMATCKSSSGTAIGHNRWATHGKPSVENAHPHFSTNNRIAVVHNGTVENYATLRAQLQAEGYIFLSETDTEVLPNLIEREFKISAGISLSDAVKKALLHVEGTYGIAVLSADFPGDVVVAALHSPIVIGIAEHGLFVASDETALAGVAERMFRLYDFDIATLHVGGSYEVAHSSADSLNKRLELVPPAPHNAVLGQDQHMMRMEIEEQPDAIARTLSGRLDPIGRQVKLGGLADVRGRLATTRRIIIVACGTSYHAGMVGKLLIEKFAGVPVEVDYASEFSYRDLVLGPQDTVLAISQSGETADTIHAIKRAREYGALCLGITNRTGTTLPRHTDAGVFLQAGPEHAVASTKAFTAQVAVLGMMAIELAMIRNDGHKEEAAQFAVELGKLPELLRKALTADSVIQKIAQDCRRHQRVVFIGRRFGVPAALEGALKLKEIAYVDAHGYPAGELKHGPLALVEEGTPVIAIAPSGDMLKKMVSNIEEVRSRGGKIIVLTTEGNHEADHVADYVVTLPEAPEELTSIIAAPALQLFAYHMGVLRGVDVDTPRNLAKAVTVE